MRPARRACAVLGLWLALLLHPGSYAAAAPAARSAAAVALIGTGGFTWSDVSASATPTLWRLLGAGASSTVSVRSVNTNTCPVDGWLALSSGERAAAPTRDDEPTRTVDEGCPAIPEPSGWRVPGYAAYVTAARAAGFDADLGLLGDHLAAAGVSSRAIGPGAALALAGNTGTVSTYLGLEAALADPGAWGARVSVVDVGAVRDPGDLGAGEAAPAGTTAEQLAAIDRRVGAVLARLPADADVIVAGLSDAGRLARLRPVVSSGPDFPPGWLYSPSTRQRHVIQSSDLTVTVLDLVGLPVPAGLGGGVLTVRDPGAAAPAATADRYQALVDIDLATLKGHALVPPFFNALIYGQVAMYLLVWGVWRGRIGTPATRRRLVRGVRVVAISAAAVPVASFLANLIPWWRSDHPMVAVVASVGLFVALVTAAAMLPPAGRSLVGPLAVVGGVTAGVLAVDVVTGSRLQVSSMMGLQPVVGGRFYGMGNVTFSLFATGILMLAIAVSHRLVRGHRRGAAAALVATLGGLAVVVDGAPFWGADGGGPPALIPGVAFFVLALLGIAMTMRRAVAIGAITVGAFALVGFLDSLRSPARQSHLGRFFDSIGTGGALDVVIRKASANLDILLSSHLTLLVPFALVFVIYVLWRPTSWGSRALHGSFDRVTTLRPGLIAWLVVMTIGFLVNDSGVAIPSVGATVTIPLVIAIATATVLGELSGPTPAPETADPDPGRRGSLPRPTP